MTERIALIGFGEVGRLFARQWIRQGVAVTVYDRLFDDPARGGALQADAAALGATVATDHAGACRGQPLVISAVTADQAVAAARQCAPALTPGQTYVDLNSVSPSTKAEVAAALDPSGVDFVEWAVMAPVAEPGIAVPILAGGPRAAAWASRLNPLGMRIDAVADRIGVASATKLCRSIVIKGMEALMVDLAAAGAEHGVLPAVLASLTASYPGMDWAQILQIMPTRVARHGVRRAAEMREVAVMMREAGQSGALAEAIAVRHETFAAAARAAEAASPSAPLSPSERSPAHVA
ncbi:NAD(P)-dependent oxidoreductase [Prosthecomicrobium hirschii]|uniref:NAD(P)-dependent oxidoreductase n=1 Tax=Prosthecodimorpha hirschii TaxID=665126 RepID=UPI002220E80F|nr:NAD(P)-dependent oxidoreductase [Prosthecomicrobium hirschii]MCW1841897.1 DUF1932 domain-containing protein [Prosthecomicrobium hirschii]